jgi:hypothetical protein
MAGSYGLDVDKKSHCKLLMLINRMAWDILQGSADMHVDP